MLQLVVWVIIDDCINFRLKYVRNVFCNEEIRRKYDYWYRFGIVILYEQWIELSGVVYILLYWVVKLRKEFMFDYQKGKLVFIRKVFWYYIGYRIVRIQFQVL